MTKEGGDSGAALVGPMRARPGGLLKGTATAPGDKSISHRALIFGALADGETAIRGLLEGEDVLRTAAAMRALGAEAERFGDVWRVRGGPWRAPDRALYFGNSGTGVRLVMGAVAGAGVGASFDGDKSLRARPMGRVLEPLRMMGLEADDSDGRLPATLRPKPLSAVQVKLAAPSAQVKSAILLAALGAAGKTRVHEPVLSRDHTERMLSAFGVELQIESDGAEGRYIDIEGGRKLTPCGEIVVPGDPSSAAFLTAAGVITPRADITVRTVLMNPLRAGFYETLRDMGADISFENERREGGEPVADIRARASVLSGVEVPAARAPSMIDEYPILSVVAAFANGETKMTGLEELRVKESDRIASVERGLAACGVDVESGPGWLRVRGGGGPPRGGARVAANHDHRIAMSFLVMGLASREPVEIDD